MYCFLPERLDSKRVLADERAGALLEGVLRAALADAGDADVGLDGHDHVALVEERIEVRRPVDADAGDFGFRERRQRAERAKNPDRRRCGQRREKRSSVHGRAPLRGRMLPSTA